MEILKTDILKIAKERFFQIPIGLRKVIDGKRVVLYTALHEALERPKSDDNQDSSEWLTEGEHFELF